MREIHVDSIKEAVAGLCIQANYILGDDVTGALARAIQQEESPGGRDILGQLLENARLAASNRQAACQDTGTAVVFLEVGQDLHIAGGSLVDAVNEGVRKGYTKGYLRKSMASDPLFDRKNTQDNTPAVIHTEIVSGDRLKITVAPKGGGSENMGALKMLTPAQGVEGVKRFVIETVERAGANACPPMAIVGVGIGGTMEMATLLAKKALLRPLGEPNKDERYARLEKELLSEINALGIGPGGLGGMVTALAVHIEFFPTHITSLPVAVNLQCNASRHASKVL